MDTTEDSPEIVKAVKLEEAGKVVQAEETVEAPVEVPDSEAAEIVSTTEQVEAVVRDTAITSKETDIAETTDEVQGVSDDTELVEEEPAIEDQELAEAETEAETGIDKDQPALESVDANPSNDTQEQAIESEPVQESVESVEQAAVQEPQNIGTIVEEREDESATARAKKILEDEDLDDQKGENIESREQEKKVSLTGQILEKETENFPIIEKKLDSTWLSELNIQDSYGKKKTLDTYTQSCKELGIIPVSFFASRISDEKVIMPYHGLGEKGARAMSSVLELNNFIQHLDLSNNWCGKGGMYLAQALKNNVSLVYLDLSFNNLAEYGGKDFYEMLVENTSLHILKLKGNKLKDGEATFIAAGLKVNSTLKELDLSYNEIGDIGATELGIALEVNNELMKIDLSWNHIRPKGVAGFLSHSKENINIISLFLDHNGINESGNQLASYLQKNQHLEVVSIGNTRISESSMLNLVKSIEQHVSLAELNLSGNPITDTSAALLFKACGACSTLKKLNLTNVRLSKEGRSKLDELREQRGNELIVVE